MHEYRIAEGFAQHAFDGYPYNYILFDDLVILPVFRMPLAGVWFEAWVYLGLVCGWAGGARPRFDTSTDMGLVLIPADAEVDSVIFRLRATDQDADFPLVFEVTATITPVVRIDNLPCTLYNKVCQANVILTKRLVPGRLHDFAVRVRDTKGDTNSMQATISATNATTSRDKIFPHIPSLIMVPEDTKPGKELDYLLVRANSWSGKPVYIELWQPKELFTIRQRQTPTQTRGVITLTGELDFETQSMYTLTIYATDPYTEPGKDTRNIAGLNIVVVVQDVQDVPPIFTSAPPLTRLNNSVQAGDIILRVHAEDGDKGVPREITYGLVSEGNPFVPFFNISETTGEIVLAKSLEELTQITHVGAPVVLSVVAEEIRRSRDEPPAQATVVEVGFLLGEPGNSPPYFPNDNYVASIPENMELGSVIMFPEQYSTRVRDEDIGKAGVFALKLQNNNGTFEVNPTVAERTADFIITVRDNTLIDYEMYKSLFFKVIAQEIGPATNLSASATVVIFIQDVNDNLPVFDEESYEVTLSENVTAGTRVIQVRATDKDTGLFGSIKYTEITGQGSDAFAIDSDTGLITVAMGSSLDREMAAQLQLTVNARDENGKGNTGVVPLIVNLLDVNDNAPVFEKDFYEFTLNSDLTNFTTPAIIKATDADAESPNNEIRYELVHGNYESKFNLNEITGELILRSPITKFRRKKQSVYENFTKKLRKGFPQSEQAIRETTKGTTTFADTANSTGHLSNQASSKRRIDEIIAHRGKRAATDVLYTLTVRAYDLGVPHLASETQVSIVRGTAMEARVMMFVVPGERPNLTRTAETLATITGGRVTVLDTRPYVPDNRPGVTGGTVPAEGKRTIVIARVEQTEPGAPLVDVEKIRDTLAANGLGIIGGMGATDVSMTYGYETTTKLPIDGITHDGGGGSAGTYVNKTISSVHEEVTVYKAENKLLFWLLIILGLLMLLAIAALIICCICPGCPFYMAPRKRRVYSSETLIARSDGRPKRHLHRKPMAIIDITSNGRKQAWSADPTRRNWQFNRRNTKNGGLASLPGDVVYISERPPIDQVNAESLRLRDGPAYDPSRRRRMEEQERMYVEDVEDRKIRDYDGTDADSLQRHEIERGSDILRQAYRQRYVDHESNNEQPAIREQHFYREGNAEVLQLVTRGQVEDDGSSHQRHYPTTLIVDGKDVLLQRFMQDQKARHELQEPMPETMRTVESHHRQKNLYQHQQEILLLPEDLELRHRRADELRSSAQNLAMDDRYEMQKMDAETQIRDTRRQEVSMNLPGVSSIDRPSMPKDQTQSTTMQSYAFHDLELARQNALLTRLLLERESRHAAGAMMADATSYLETQSLPGQVAIATQTDRAAATQTERHARSRSDNDESDEDGRNRKKTKMKKRHGEYDSKRTRTLWMKSPIEEEDSPCFDKRLNILRKKVKEVKEGRKVSLEPGVLREISDSLDENGGPCHRERGSTKTYQKPAEESSARYKALGDEKNGSTSSTEVSKQQYERTSDEKKATENSSSPEISLDNGKYIRETTEKKSTRKESRTKKQKKVESVIKPSFRVLEREITMLTKKLSKLADKKTQQTTVESVSQRKSRTSKDSKKDIKKDVKDPDHVISGKTETSKEHKRPETPPSTSKDTAVVTKTRDKFKYQQPPIMSPGSPEYEDAFGKPKKSKPAFRQKVAKHKQMSIPSHTKMKKHTQTQIDRKEHRQQVDRQRTDREVEKHKDAIGKESSRSESKTERIVKSLSRTQKLAAIGRREPVAEEPSASTSSDQANGKKDSFADRSSDKSKSIVSSEIASDQRESKGNADRTSDGFSDDFVAEIQREDIEQQDAFRSLTDTSALKRDTEGAARDAQVTQQFTDDFEIEQINGKEREISIAAEDISKAVHGISHDSEEERAVLKKAAEDFAFSPHLGYVQLKDESTSDAAKEQQTELFEAFRTAEQLDDRDQEIIPPRFVAPKAPKDIPKEEHQRERPSSPGSRGVEEEVTRTSGEEETKELPREIEKEALGIREIMLEKHVHELKVSKDAEKIVERKEEADALEKHAESLEVPSITAEQKWYKENGLCTDVDVSSSPEIEEDSKDIKDVAGSLHPNGKDNAVGLRKIEDDAREKLSHDSKEHSEEETPLEESTIDAKRVIEELAQTENGGDLLRTTKSDVEKETKLTATDSDGHEDAIEKPKDIPKEYLIQDLEKVKEDAPSTSEALEIVSDISPSLQEDPLNLIDIHRTSLIDESDQVSMDIDTVTQEISKDDLTQSELSTIREKDLARQDTDTDKFEPLSSVPVTKIEIESHEAKEELSHVSPPKELDLRKTKLSGVEEPLTPLTEVPATQEKVTGSEQLEAEHMMEEEKPYREEREKEKEQSLEIKERTDEEMKETLDKEPIGDQSPEEAELEKSVISKPVTTDESEMFAESADAAVSQTHQDQEEERAETVSVPIFTSFIDTLELSEESDSSSDISRKTTLTPRPYDTPRHRQKWRQQESLEIAGISGTNTFEAGNGVAVETEAEEDTDSNLSLDEIENVEESIAAEAAIGEQEEVTEIAVLSETISFSDENIMAVSDMEKINVADEQDRVLESEFKKAVEPEIDTEVDVKGLSTTIRDGIPFISSIKELSGISKENVEKESIPVIKESAECTSKSAHHAKIEEVLETAKQDSEGEIRSPPDKAGQVDSKGDRTRTEDVKVDKTKTRDAEVDKTKRKGGIVRSMFEKHAARTESSESSLKKKRKLERSKAFSPAKKKDVLDEESEEKAVSMRSRHRSRGYADDDLDKRKDSGSQKQLRREEEHQRKQPLPRSKPKTDRRSTTSVKTGEIDTSKTQSKYMAWYNKKREEMERKRLEKKVIEDQGQLPRWVSRSLKKHRTTEQRDKQSARRKTPEMTPRTRRKIKPLVNVESEQLKAIVRQGRQLRKAESNLKEDPPIQIFARTPPAPPPDTRHRLVQHSEYKYEKIPPPFYLHPPPAPHPSPQLSPERSFEMQPSTSQYGQCEQDEPSSTDNVMTFQSGGRLRHQQLLEKKSVFDIAYSEAAPSQLRSDSATPPS